MAKWVLDHNQAIFTRAELEAAELVELRALAEGTGMPFADKQPKAEIIDLLLEVFSGS
jgi:hypothetical protein